jgi:hypothetical protein
MTKNYAEIRNTTESEPTQNQRGLTTLMIEISESFLSTTKQESISQNLSHATLFVPALYSWR